MDGERKHQPTPNRLAQAVREGDCFYSTQLAIVMVLSAAGLLAMLGASWVGQALSEWTSACWREPLTCRMASGSPWSDSVGGATRVCVPLAAGLFLLWCGAWLAYMWQTGWVFGKKPLVSWEGMSPQARWSQMYSLKRTGSNVLGIVQAAVVVGVLAWLVIARHDVLLALWSLPPSHWGMQLGVIVQSFLGPVALTVCGVALLDYWWQRVMFHRGLRMTDQELREELQRESRKR